MPHFPTPRSNTHYCGRVHRSELAIAALATVAIPGLDIYQARTAPAPDGCEAAFVLDSEARQWLVKVPLNAGAGSALEAETAFLKAVEPYVSSGSLPFVVPQPAGYAPLLEGGRAIVYPRIVGNPLDISALRPGPGASASLGRAIGALHSLPINIVEDSGFPSYSTEQYRERRLAELDEGATSGLVPVPLLRRWESALENVALWRFAPVITHTNLSAESVIMSHGQVGGITDWSQVQVGDPADDLAWLVAAAPVESADSIIEAYQLRRAESLDKHLIDRAMLGSELALLRWLLHGVRGDNAEIIEDAQSMLADLLEATVDDTHTGSFTVSTLPAPRDRMPVVRMIGDTSNISIGSGDESTVGPEHNALSSNSEPERFTDDDHSSSFEDELNSNDQHQNVPASLPDTGDNDLESREEYEVPDYAHARPPRPWADTQTALMTALSPHENDGVQRSPEGSEAHGASDSR